MSTSHLVLGFALLGLLASGCANDGSANPAPTVTETVTETPSPPSSDQQGPTDRSTGPWGDPLLLVDGRWLVGEDADIPPTGALITPHSVFACAWRVTDAAGVIVEEATVTNPGGAVVSLQDGDLFESADCIVWEFVDLSAVNSIEPSGGPLYAGDPLLPGTYIVGENIRAGTYSQQADGVSGECGYSLKRPNGVRILEEVSFETTNIGARSRTNEVLDLESGDIFESTCGTWRRWKD